MTYCVAIAVEAGLVFCSDSRTNAGVDQISTYSKMHTFGIEGQRQFVLLSAGNLATTQAVVSQIKRDIRRNAEENLLTMGSVKEAADYVGEISRSQQEKYADGGSTRSYEASFLLGGQVAGKKPRITMIYPQGNNITTSQDTRFLQIGESKYGKPILDRIITPETELDTAALCSLVSMDSTMRSNLTVGPPIELVVYQADSFRLNHYLRFEEDSGYLRELKRHWDQRLKEAFKQLPPLSSAVDWDALPDAQNEAY